MRSAKVVIVHLRRPRNEKDKRNDPFWELGSFGLTGCHCRNLLHPNNAHQLIGMRLAFAQGGSLGTRLVLLTPPITRVVIYSDRTEALWSPWKMPFRYSAAPLLINNGGKTEFSKLKRLLRGGKRDTWVGQFGADFRTRKRPLTEEVARQIIRHYERFRKSKGGRTAIAPNYADALPGKRKPIPFAERIKIYEEKHEDAARSFVVHLLRRVPCAPRRKQGVC